VAAPSKEELAHHYLWRFARNMPKAGHITIFDRTWYGRVLVERVEGFAAEAEWRRAYDEINEFELQLVSHGTALVKFWLHLSPEEQLRRFSEREVVPWKQHKLTGEDWRNRERWQDYLAAVNDMLAFTDRRPDAPWHVIPANDKRYARVAVIEAVCERLRASLVESKRRAG
jgi:polyphosphate kinase 2 (PPK2 family)